MTPILDAPARALADRCPGLLRPHRAEDGALVRLRLPGGRIDSATLLELSRISVDLGQGSLQLTSRGNLQLRGVDEARLAELVDRVAALGLLPSTTHERVRNLVASPLTGLGGLGAADVAPLVGALDAALCAAPELADLPGRFLFALDDGSCDVLTLRFDLAFVATGADSGLVLAGGTTYGIHTPLDGAAGLLVELARSFVRLRAGLQPSPWHVTELSSPALLDPRLAPVDLDPDLGRPLQRPDPGRPLTYGAVAGAASLGVPLSLLEPAQVETVHRVAHGGPVVITPWRGLVIPAAAAALAQLGDAGLVTDDGSAWSRVTACVGSPGCAKSVISTRELAADLFGALGEPPSLPVHVSGCERRCGAPNGPYADLVAPRSLASALDQLDRAAAAPPGVAS